MNDTIRLPSQDVILSPENISGLARMYRQLETTETVGGKPLSRRTFADWICDQLFLFEGVILLADGSELQVTDTFIDDAWNNDGSYRWTSAFARFAKRPPQRAANSNLLSRIVAIMAAGIIAGRYRAPRA